MRVDNSSTRQRMLSAWTVVALRPTVECRALRRRLQTLGAGLLCVPGLRLCAAADAQCAALELAAALEAPLCIFTSPAAVRFARALRPLADYRGRGIAVGLSTAAALRRAGVRDIRVPASQRSEGVLALPELQGDLGPVGLVTAPGGRDLLAPSLQARGARITRAEVYERQPARLDRRHRDALQTLRAPYAVLLSSAEALDAVLTQLDEPLSQRLRHGLLIAASPRLADHAEQAGFAQVGLAASARWPDLLEALQTHAKAARIG